MVALGNNSLVATRDAIKSFSVGLLPQIYVTLGRLGNVRGDSCKKFTS